VRVTLLGPVSASADGLELALGGPKQRAVFALLALNAGRVVSLDRLVDELWTDEQPSRSTLALQSYMSRLRRVLAHAAGTCQDVPHILTRAPGWLLTLPPDDVDATRFQVLVADARRLVERDPASRAPDAAAILRDALELWVGDPMSGLGSAPFAREEAARLEELRLSATELLLESMLTLGESDAVADEARQFVASNPFRERGWCALMLGLYRSGRQSDALAAAAQLRRILSDELGLDPSPETRDLELRILRQDGTLESAAGHPTGHVAVEPQQPSSGRIYGETASGRIVGRDDVRTLLDDAVSEAARGRGRLLVLGAPAGLGKSTMLQVLEDRVRSSGGAVVRGTGGGAGAMPALWPWVTIVRQLADLQTLPEAASAETTESLAATAITLLQHGGAAGPPHAPGDAAQDKTSLYRGVVDLLSQTRAMGTLAVLIDDAHWVDDDTLTLLSLAADELVDQGVLFAVAFRSDEPSAAAIEELLGAARRGIAARVMLRGLDTAEVAEVMRDVSGTEPDPAMASALRERTWGNPLFVTELVRMLASEGRLDTESVYGALPGEVREVLGRRLERLPAQTIALLTVAAVVGRPTEVDLLSRVTGLDADAVLDSCESALVSGLLVEATEPRRGFSLSHDLVRQTLEESLSSARLLRIHAKVADALEARGVRTAPDVVEIAHHLTLAASVVGPEAAIPYLIAASDDALSRYANDQAEQNLMTALGLVARIPDPVQRAALEGPVRARLTLLLLTTSGTERRPAPRYDQVAITPMDSDAEIGWLGMMIQATVVGDYLTATTSAERALEANPTAVGQFSAHFILGFASLLLGQHALAEREFVHLERLIDRGFDVHITGFFSGSVVSAAESALVAHLRGNESAADAHLVAAHDRAAGDDSDLVIVEQHHCWLAAMRGDAVSARAHASACTTLAERLHYGAYLLAASMVGGWADAMLNDASGIGRADSAYQQYSSTGLTMYVPLYVMLRAEAHAAHGAASTARRLVRESRAISVDSGQRCLGPRLTEWAEELVPTLA
jgi:DNA-binding SARP family transcriptional activator